RLMNIRSIFRDLDVSGSGLLALNLDPDILEEMYYLQASANGLLTYAGPTGSGKSTLLDLDLQDRSERSGNRLSILRVDDPPEGIDRRIWYVPVRPAEGPDDDPLAETLHDSLRTAPHVFSVGECRTPMAARVAVEAALTGKLVPTTLHAD